MTAWCKRGIEVCVDLSTPPASIYDASSKRVSSTSLPPPCNIAPSSVPHLYTVLCVDAHTKTSTMGLMKPFRPPTVVARTPSNSDPAPSVSSEPPQKKRRISSQSDDGDPEVVAAAAKVLKKSKPLQKFQPLVQKSTNPTTAPSASQADDAKSSGPEDYYTVLWYDALLSLCVEILTDWFLGASSPLRRTRHGMAMASLQSPAAMLPCRTSRARISDEPLARLHS